MSLSTGSTVSVPHLSDPYAVNEAVNSLKKECFISTGYTNRLFLPQIGRASLDFVYPSKALNTSAGFSFYGFSEYWNIEATIGFSRLFKPYIAIGVEAFFYGCHFNTDVKFCATGGLNVGLLAFPTRNLTIGLYAHNISFSPLKSLEERYRLPVIFRLGISYNFSGKALIILEGAKELKQPFLICMGVEYMPVRQFILRLGVSYQTSAACSGGFGLRFGGFFIDAGVEYKLMSGLSISTGVGYRFKGKSEK